MFGAKGTKIKELRAARKKYAPQVLIWDPKGLIQLQIISTPVWIKGTASDISLPAWQKQK